MFVGSTRRSSTARRTNSKRNREPSLPVKSGSLGLEFSKASEIYRSDVAQSTQRDGATQRRPSHRLDESRSDYSLASCSPAELASASSDWDHCAIMGHSRKEKISEWATLP